MEENEKVPAEQERKLPEKPLEKMTAPELRELAKGFGVQGVHAMKKEELIPILKEAYGIKDEGPKKAAKTAGKTVTVQEVKSRIARLKKEKAAALEAGDQRKRDILRRRINRDKKRSRRAVHA
jgi:hypothetical protein